jgi:hypothetical protein
MFSLNARPKNIYQKKTKKEKKSSIIFQKFGSGSKNQILFRFSLTPTRTGSGSSTAPPNPVLINPKEN